MVADAVVLGSCREVLADGGYECVEAATGSDALALLRMGLTVDLAVVDYRLAGMSGIEVIERMRGELHLRTLPVVLRVGAHDLGVNLQTDSPPEPPPSSSRCSPRNASSTSWTA